MRLYHGSDVTIEKPDAIHLRKNLDFGSGFYATSYPKQAERWALRRSLRSHGKALVNVYEFDETANLHILRFNENDAERVRFVCNCRRGGQPPLGTDLIIGGVADDKVYAAIDMYYGTWNAPCRPLPSTNETTSTASSHPGRSQPCDTSRPTR